MKPEAECRVTASFLESGRVVCHASHCGAAMAGLGVLLARAAGARLLLAGSLPFWLAGIYLGVRVAIDASLFQLLAGGAGDGWQALDELRARPARTLEERRGGAMRLWVCLLAAVAIQLALLMAGLAVQALAS